VGRDRQLLREIEESSYLAVGRKYGVSDNAIRKWVRCYERERKRVDREAIESDDRQLGASATRRS
jgi:transposase-like protein